MPAVALTDLGSPKLAWQADHRAKPDVTGNPLETKKSVSHSIFEADARPNCRPDAYGSSIALPSSSLRRGRATLIAKVGAGQVVIARITLSADENRSRSHLGNTRACDDRSD
jgi:hypothetical protein